jgi:hypothetical protein
MQSPDCHGYQRFLPSYFAVCICRKLPGIEISRRKLEEPLPLERFAGFFVALLLRMTAIL